MAWAQSSRELIYATLKVGPTGPTVPNRKKKPIVIMKKSGIYNRLWAFTRIGTKIHARATRNDQLPP